MDIWIFGFGLLCGHILASFCNSNLTQWFVDRITSHIKKGKETRKAQEAERIWQKQNSGYIKLTKNMKKAIRDKIGH